MNLHSFATTTFLVSAFFTGTALAEGMGQQPPTGSTEGGFGSSGPGTTTTPPVTTPATPSTSQGTSTTPTPPTARSMDMAPMVLVVPTYYAMDPNVGNGCWARLFDKRDFTGSVFAMVGPVDIASNRPGFITGFESGRNFDSLTVGPTATLTVWDHDNFQKKSTTFAPGDTVPDLDSRMGSTEEIKSMSLSCSR